MNKGKIILSALGILAVVGSALAFKANRTYGGNLRCSTFTTTATTGTLASEFCPDITYTTLNGIAKRYCTFATLPEADCVIKTVTTNQ